MLSSLAREHRMLGARSILAFILSATLVAFPVWGAPAATAFGTVITAEHAYVGTAPVEVGTTLYSGDQLRVEEQGSVQLRAGAARLLLLRASMAVVNEAEGAPSARLFQGSAKFSTGNAHAFTLFASKAAVRPQSDAPTIAQVTYLNEKELLVTAQRGGLTVTVGDQTEIIPEGTAYRVILDPPPGMAAASGQGGPPLKAGRSRFVIVAVAVVAGVTVFALHEVFESADRP